MMEKANFEHWVQFFRGASKVRLPGQAWQVLNCVMAKTLNRREAEPSKDCAADECAGNDLEFNVKAIALELGMARTSVSRAIMVLRRKNALKVSNGTTNKQLRYLRVVRPELWGIYGTQKEGSC
jgi:hypothetical protein